MQDESNHNDTTISLKNGFKNIRRQTPTRPQKLLPETQVEKTNQDTKPEADFTILATRLKEINFTNMSNSAKQCILQKVTELQNKGHHLERLQRQHTHFLQKQFWKTVPLGEMCWTIRSWKIC